MSVKIYPAPDGLAPSANYRLYIDGREVFVYDTQVALDAIDPSRNAHSPYMSSYAIFDADEGRLVDVRIEPLFTDVCGVNVSPASRGITAARTRNCVTFAMRAPDLLSVEINGLLDRTLMIFANPPEINVPDPDDENVIYYGPGLHVVDGPDNMLTLKSGQTLYLAGGSLVTGIIRAEGAENIKIKGRGILHATGVAGRWPNERRAIVGWPADAPQRHNQIVLMNCKGVEIEGIAMIDSPAWTVRIGHCEDLLIHNIKIIGYQMNNDGVDICSSKNAVVRDSFIRCSDDCLVVKCLFDKTGANVGVENLEFNHCTIWADRASAIEIGHEECAPEVAHIRFTDIDILHQKEETYGYHAIDITNTDFADIHDILFEDIRIERCARMFGARVREGVFGRSGYSEGRIRDITVKNIRCDGNPHIFLAGRDGEHAVYDIRFEDIYVGGRPLTSLEGVFRNPYVRDVALFSDGKQVDSLIPYPPAAECAPIDISPMCNIVAGHNFGINGMASPDWAALKSGVSVMEGVPFNLTGQGYAPNGDYKRFATPSKRRRSGIPARLEIGEKANWLFFLQTTIHAISEMDSLLCRYVITYSDGASETIRVRNMNDAHDFRHWSLAGWQVVFGELRAYIMPWRNPHPDNVIESVTMLEGEIPELPVLMAITRA